MKKHVIAVEAKKKLSHAMGTLNKANRFFGAFANAEDTDDLDKTSGGSNDLDQTSGSNDEETIPCGACEAIKTLKLDEEFESDSEDEELENFGK